MSDMVVKPAQISEQLSLDDSFRQSMREVAASVAVLTTGDQIAQAAMTMTAACTVSMSPPSILICVNRQASAYPILLRGAGFSLNYLGSTQERLARLCSKRESVDHRLKDEEFTRGVAAIPCVRGAVASLLCEQDGRYLYGTHAVIIGRVISVDAGGSMGPLIYLNGRYTRTADDLPPN